MSLSALDAAAAYGRIGASSLRPPAAGAATPPANGGFAALVEDAASAMKTAEAATARQVAGKGDLIDVVTAIGAAETALDTVVAVRDRVVNAYQDIMRMQI